MIITGRDTSRGRTASWRRVLPMALAAVMALAPVAGMAWAKGKTGEDFEWAGPIAAGKSLEIKGINGDVMVSASSDNQAHVFARKSAHKSDPDEVEIEVIEHPGGVTICAKYPTPWGESPNECGPGDKGHMHTRNNDVTVDFTVEVPGGAGFIGRTVNGDVRAVGLKAAASAYTVNGSIKIETRGTAQATTVNGSIDAEMGAPTGDEVEFEAVNGGITVSMPASSGVDVRASTVNGSISTDFPITVSGKFSPRSLRGTIGKGGPDLKLNTVNGSIRLRTRSAS